MAALGGAAREAVASHPFLWKKKRKEKKRKEKGWLAKERGLLRGQLRLGQRKRAAPRSWGPEGKGVAALGVAAREAGPLASHPFSFSKGGRGLLRLGLRSGAA